MLFTNEQLNWQHVFACREHHFLTIPKRLVNDKASEEHYAIVPTDTAIKAHIDELSRNEKNIFLLIMYRLFAALSPDYEYYRTELKSKYMRQYV